MRPFSIRILVAITLLSHGCHLIFPFDVTADAAADLYRPWDGTEDANTGIDSTPGDAPAAKDVSKDMDWCTCAAADIDKNGKVDSSDLDELGFCWNEPADNLCQDADINKDGKVDSEDLACLNIHYGAICS